MHSDNPYAAPTTKDIVSTMAEVDPSTYSIEGNKLLIRDGAQLPNICIRTGQEMTEVKRRKQIVYWTSPWWALLIFGGFILYIIVYLCIRKKFTVHYSISRQALMKHRLTVGTTILMCLVGLPASVYIFSISDQYPTYKVLGWILLAGSILGLIITSVFSTIIRPKKHHDGWLSISGVSKSFIQVLHSENS